MRARRNRWFTIVATDMFSGAFAAIVLLDTVTPKQKGLVASVQEIRITYPMINGARCPDSTDGNAVVFSYVSGDPVSTIDKGFQAAVVGGNCQISGPLDIYTPEVNDPCVLWTLGGARPAKIRVEMTGSQFAGDVASCQ